MHVVAVLVILFILAQSAFFLTCAYRRRKELGISPQKLKKAILSTLVFTILTASIMIWLETYAVPNSMVGAMIGANLRLLSSNTVESAITRLKKLVNRDKIKAKSAEGMNPSIFSRTDCEDDRELEVAIRQARTETIVSPA